jgi:hypothetical protein
VPAAFITTAEWQILSGLHKSQWVPYTTSGGARGYAPAPNVVPFLTGYEYTKLVAGNQARFSPFITSGGARGWEPTALMVPHLAVDGVFDERTSNWTKWAQKVLGLTADGRVGQTTMRHLMWPYVNGLVQYSPATRQIVGGIAEHESHYDPGAVGYEDPDDIGLVQINGPANPTLSEADRFDYRKAFTYALDRVSAALTTPNYTTDAAIASYGYPGVAAAWVKSGSETYPQNPQLNQQVLDYVAFIEAWKPGF